MALTIDNTARQAALNGITALLAGGDFQLLATSTELAALPFQTSGGAFANASSASPSTAVSTAIGSDTSVTPGTINTFKLRNAAGTAIITGTVMAKLTTGLYGNLRSVHFPVDSNEGWFCGSGIIRHFVGGAWQADQGYANNGYNAIAFSDNLNGWAVGDEGVIVHTTTGGKVDGTHVSGWYVQIEPDPHSSQRTSNGLYALNAMEAWAIGDFGVILHTTNGGETWAPEASGLTTSLLRAVHAEDSHTVYVVGNDGTFLKYTDAAPGFDHSLHLPLIVR